MRTMWSLINRATRQTGSGWLYLTFSFASITWSYGLKWGLITAAAILTLCVGGQLIIGARIDGLRGAELWVRAYRRAFGVKEPRRPFQTFPSDL